MQAINLPLIHKIWKKKKKQNQNWLHGLRTFLISNADGRKKCNASVNLKDETQVHLLFLESNYSNYCYHCQFHSYTFRIKTIQVKAEIHSYAILQMHNSFEEAKNFPQFRELFMFDQLSEEFPGQTKNFLNSKLWCRIEW